MKKLWYFLVVSMFCFSFSALSQETQKKLPIAAPDRLIIINETGEKQAFLLGEESGELTRREIEKDETWISESFRQRPHIRIYNGEKYQEYMLITGKVYRMYFDNRKKCVDIKIQSQFKKKK